MSRPHQNARQLNFPSCSFMFKILAQIIVSSEIINLTPSYCNDNINELHVHTLQFIYCIYTIIILKSYYTKINLIKRVICCYSQLTTKCHFQDLVIKSFCKTCHCFLFLVYVAVLTMITSCKSKQKNKKFLQNILLHSC